MTEKSHPIITVTKDVAPAEDPVEDDASALPWESLELDDEVVQKISKVTIGDYLKLLAVVLPPLLALATISSLLLTQVIESHNDAEALVDHLRESDAIRNLIHMLQRERGITCIFLGSGSDVSESVLQTMKERQSDSDRATIGWMEMEDGIHMTEKENFKRRFHSHRAAILKHDLDCYENTIFFGNIIDELLVDINKVFRMEAEGVLWNTIESYLIGLKAKELIDLQCGADYLFEQSFVAHPGSKKVYTELRSKNGPILGQLESMTTEVLTHSVTDKGSNKSLDWFFAMTKYIDLLGKVQSHTVENLISILTANKEAANFQYNAVIVTVTISLLVCSLLLIMYLYEGRRLMKKIQRYTENLGVKTKELKDERKRTDGIIYQLLPVSIAKKLAKSERVQAEYYEEVSIFCSSIFGFAQLVDKSNPSEVVNLLDELYTRCDEVIGRYEVYKLETNGDSFMVGSGFPKRINARHSNEIATMALDKLNMMQKFEIPHWTSESLLMKIGIHTGPCIAGLVGTKMPKYSLFGETVKTATEMEHSGSALRIHVSEATHRHLKSNFSAEFETKRRDTASDDTKINVAPTFWLVRKVGFHFHVDPAQTEASIKAATYWKPETRISEVADL